MIDRYQLRMIKCLQNTLKLSGNDDIRAMNLSFIAVNWKREWEQTAYKYYIVRSTNSFFSGVEDNELYRVKTTQ